MSSPVPTAVKAADLSRFAMRAGQLEKAKPVISYYCNFWIVNQILSRNLHNTDEECLAYTTNLMDKLEQFKADNRENDVVTDDLAGRAYVEQFGVETFQRANNTVRAKKASRQTADTFQAAATFLELLQIWGEIELESAAKIKYAKYHALRIAKALKSGQNPNASNPATEADPSEDALPALDPDDAEVQMLNGASTKPQQPSVTDVPDESDKAQRNLARQLSLGESLHPSRASSVPRLPATVPRPKVEEATDDTDQQQSRLARQSAPDQSLHPSREISIPPQPQDDVSPLDASASAEDFYNQSSQHDISPLDPEHPNAERKSSIGGNYFPQVPPPPQPREQQPSFDLPSAPSDSTPPPPEPVLPPAITAFSPSPLSQPQTQQPHFISPTQPVPTSLQSEIAPHQPISPAPPHLRQGLQQQPPQAYAPQTAITAPPPPPLQQTNPAADEEAMAKAQKHARWAISALNFEDVPTAVRELRGALESLDAM